MSKTNAYNPNKVYDEDCDYTIPGRVVNQISKMILELEQEIEELKEAELNKELEDLRIRDRHPPVKDAWDQYLTVLTLAREK